MSTPESDDSCAHLAIVLNNGRRVNNCRHGIQWILQYRNRAETVARHVWSSASLPEPPDEILPSAEL